jgi:hypothetical protein
VIPEKSLVRITCFLQTLYSTTKKNLFRDLFIIYGAAFLQEEINLGFFCIKTE